MTLLRLIICLVLSIACSFLSLSAQTNAHRPGSWLIGTNLIRFHENWSINNQAQVRSYQAFHNTEQILLRTGVDYHINSDYSVSAGYAHVFNYNLDKELSPGVQVSEYRVWEQFMMNNKLGRVYFIHRYRLEQRWSKSNIETKYRNRFRYFLRINIALNNKEIKTKTLYLSIYNEIFIHISQQPFDRNRLYGSIAYRISPQIDIQVGYMLQSVPEPQHLLQTTLMYIVDLRRNKSN